MPSSFLRKLYFWPVLPATKCINTGHPGPPCQMQAGGHGLFGTVAIGWIQPNKRTCPQEDVTILTGFNLGNRTGFRIKNRITI